MGFALEAVLLGGAPPAGRRDEVMNQAAPVLRSELLGLIVTSLA
ncbi:hypothetical protein ACODT3_35425 [Streptomyces sp. 4.24]